MRYRQVSRRAGGRCEYCLAPQVVISIRHEVEHIIPLCRGGNHLPENLALACCACNGYKGAATENFDALTGESVRLFNPRTDVWSEHFEIERTNGMIEPLTAIGRVTVGRLRLNAARHRRARKQWLEWGWPKKARP